MLSFFTNPLICLKQDDFKITLRDEGNGSKDYIKVSLVLKIAFWFEILAITEDQPIILLLNLYLLLYFSKQPILSGRKFCVGSDVYSIWCIFTFPNQAFLDQVMET